MAHNSMCTRNECLPMLYIFNSTKLRGRDSVLDRMQFGCNRFTSDHNSVSHLFGDAHFVETRLGSRQCSHSRIDVDI